jgi:UDP-N-acetyl-D-galactosamine dehydrogenase
VCDPWADVEEVKHEYGVELAQVDAGHPVDSLIIAVGHNEFRNLSPEQLRAYTKGEQPVLADVKSLFNRDDMVAQGFTVFRL